MDLRQIKTRPDDFGLMTYDPAFMNTANCRSAITYIDGDKGILLYRGYPIEQLAEHSDYLETAYLILFGELPTDDAAAGVDARDHAAHDAAREHQEVHGGLPVRRPPDGHLPEHGRRAVDVLSATRSTSSTRRRGMRQTHRLIAKVPSIAAYAYRHSIGRPYIYPDNDLSFTGNFLNMLFKMTELKYQPNPVLARALDVLFILHADHEQNCSTSDDAHHRQLARRSVLGAGRRGRGALRPAARRRQRSGAAHAERDRLGRPRCRSSSRR